MSFPVRHGYHGEASLASEDGYDVTGVVCGRGFVDDSMQTGSSTFQPAGRNPGT